MGIIFDIRGWKPDNEGRYAAIFSFDRTNRRSTASIPHNDSSLDVRASGMMRTYGRHIRTQDGSTYRMKTGILDACSRLQL